VSVVSLHDPRRQYLRVLAEVAAFIPYVGLNGSSQEYIGVLTVDPGQDPTPLSTPSANAINTPVMSPDGQWIVWKQAGDIWVIRSDGTDEAKVWDGGLASIGDGSVYHPTFNGDMSEIIFAFNASVPPPQDTIWTIPFDGTDQSGNETALYVEASNRQITSVEFNYDWSKVGFAVINGANSELWVMDPDGSNATHIETTPGSGFLDGAYRMFWFKAASRFVWNDGTAGSPVWKAIDDDGSNITTVHTHVAGDGTPTRESISWEDDFMYYTKDSTREHWSVTTDGTDTTALVYDGGTTAFSRGLWAYPQAPTRLYAQVNDPINGFYITSVLPDGSDYRQETTPAGDNARLQ
jgi:hypothetical protein